MPNEPGKKINVLFLSRWYPHRYDPMPGLFVERHAEAVATYCNVYVLYVHADKNLYRKHQVYFEDKGSFKVYKIYYPAVRSNIPVLSNIKKGIRYIRYNLHGIKRIQQDGFKADIYHINILTRLGLVGLHQKIFKKTPYIITEHWSRYLPITNTYHGILRKLFTRIITRNAGAVTTVTSNLKNAMISHGINNKNYHVVPNVVETSKYIPAEKSKSDKKTIVHISCFEDRSKNISGILEAAKKLSEQRNDFIIKMVGEGIDLDAMIAKSKMDDTFDKTVFFTGLLENEALIKELQQADFLLMFSNYENMPVVINEALSCGTPVLSSKVGGIAEVVNDTNGKLINAGNMEELLEGINYMLDHSEQFEAKKLREFAVENFSYEAVGRQFAEIYKGVIRK